MIARCPGDVPTVCGTDAQNAAMTECSSATGIVPVIIAAE